MGGVCGGHPAVAEHPMTNIIPRVRIPSVGDDFSGPRWASAWLNATNAERNKANLPPYQPHEVCERAAETRVAYLVAKSDELLRAGAPVHQAIYLQHDDPAVTGETYHERLLAEGFNTWLFAGENLAANLHSTDPLALALQSLMASPTHRANILASDFTHMGSWAGITLSGWHVFAFVFAGVAP